MERHEYEKLMEMIKALENIVDWRSFFGDKMTKVNNQDKKISEVMEQLTAAKSYDELDNSFKVYDEWVEDVNKGVSNMQQIAKFYGAKFNADNTVEKLPDANEARKDEADLDKSFFGRIAKTMGKARKDSWKNSSEFDKMEEELGKLNELINGESNIPEKERDEKLFDALDALEKSTDKYLEHKVKKGVNANAVAKVEAATSMKDYIKERKAEIFRRQLSRDIKKALPEKEEGYKYSPYEIKGAEAVAAGEYFKSIFEKNNISSEKIQEMKAIFRNANALAFTVEDGFKPNQGVTASPVEVVSSFLTAEFMRNELLTGGGEITPMMKQFMEGPEAFRRTMAGTGIVLNELLEEKEKGKYNEKNVDKFVSRDTNANVVYSYANSGPNSLLLNKNFFESELGYRSNMIQEEKEAREKQKAENAAREKVKLEELKKQEKAKEISDKYKENLKLARSYAALAKFAKENNFSGPEWGNKTEECFKLAREYQEKAMFGEKNVEDKAEKKTGKFNKSEKSQEKTL